MGSSLRHPWRPPSAPLRGLWRVAQPGSRICPICRGPLKVQCFICSGEGGPSEARKNNNITPGTTRTSPHCFHSDWFNMDPASSPYGKIVEVQTLLIKEYVVRERSFTKRELLPEQLQKGPDGKPEPWKWSKERLLNEAYALGLVKEHTTIPVPRLLDFGVDDQGRTFVTMERIDGIQLGDIGDECRMPASGGTPHVSVGKCDVCADIANNNADNFITKLVLPQLQQLTSYKTGLNGFVLPPPRITETIPRDTWQSITSAEEPFRFIHGDLARHNVMVSPETLEVTYIFDWEHAGYFPPELEAAAWRMPHSEYYKMFTAKERIQKELKLIGG